jgi:phosphate-selective porin OprO/OprP
MARPLATYAQTVDPKSVLIRNVTLFDPNEQADDKFVNILVRDGKLDLVTADKISRDEADLVVNAQAGIIVGKLNVGEPTSFIIFSEDPRETFEVMLDTASYATFAVHEGVVVKNQLIETVVDDPNEEPKKSGWLAYTPPPFAMPTNYRDASKWNQWESEYVNGVFIGAMVIDRANWLTQDDASEQQWGNLNSFDGGEIRGFRVGIIGTLNFNNPWVYTFFAATNAFDKGFETEDLDAFTLFDYRIDIPFYQNSVLSIGKQKEPISMERLTGGTFLPNQERSAASAGLLPSRNVGVVWSGRKPEYFATWAAGAFNDWFDANQDFEDSATQYVGRITWAPLVSEDESNLLHLGVGFRYSDAKEGFRFRSDPEFNKSTDFVDTGFHTAGKTQTYNVELAWRNGPTFLASEYTRAMVSNSNLGDPAFDGYHVTISRILTGEIRTYNKKGGVFTGIPVAKSVYQNGLGAWELYSRYSYLDLEDSLVDGGKMQIGTVGVNW